MRIAIITLGSILAFSCGDTLGAGGLEPLDTPVAVDLTQDVGRDVMSPDPGGTDPGWYHDPGGLDPDPDVGTEPTSDEGTEPDPGGSVDPGGGPEPDPDTPDMGQSPDSEEQDEGTPSVDVPFVDPGPTPSCETGGCDDGNQCTADFCLNGECIYSNLTLPCDDGNACTTGDKCTGGTCVGGPPPDCDDGDLCTDDSCEAPAGCVHEEIVCEDNDACTKNQCGFLIGCTFPPVSCYDGNFCTTDHCDSTTGCYFEPAECDDGDPCTVDFCDPEYTKPWEGCSFEPVDCDDADDTTVDYCEATTGDCVHVSTICENDDPCSTVSFDYDLLECVLVTDPQCVAWVDTDSTSCSGDIVDTFLAAIPEGYWWVSIEAHQEDPNFGDGNSTWTLGTNRFLDWLTAIKTETVLNYIEKIGHGYPYEIPFCDPDPYSGEFGLFGCDGLYVSYDGWGGWEGADWLISSGGSGAFYDRTTPPCDLTLVWVSGEPHEWSMTNNSEHGTVGDYIKITWE